MTKHIRVNVRSQANSKAARTEKRNGRDVLIVPSATLPDNVVMNGIMYPADEIEKGYKSLERTPAPLGHPMVGNSFVSAVDPEGINIGWIGAWNENVRRENGRVLLDKVIDVERANQSEDGKAVLAAINAGDPVHTSTGLWLDAETSGEGDGYDYIARNMNFDHDAILLNEEGAATPDQGVGMMVNKAVHDGEEIEVINSALSDADRDLDWAVESLARALDKREKAPMLERMKSAILEAFSGSYGGETSANNGKEADMADDKQLTELSAKVNAIEEGLNKISETITNAVTEAVKPIKDHVDQIEANQKAETEAKRAEAINALTKTAQWTEDELKDMPLSALNKLVEKSKPGKAAPLNGAFNSGDSDNDEWKGYSLNSHFGDDKKEEAH